MSEDQVATRSEAGGGRSGERAEPRLSIELDRVALRAGEELVGAVVLDLDQPASVRRVAVEVAGRELIKTQSRYQPAVYRHPVPRPWGRTRTGTVHVDFARHTALLGPPLPATVVDALGELRRDPAPEHELGAGRHHFPFRLPIPPDALATYGGASVIVEHEVTAAAVLGAGRALRAWRPLHVWAAPTDPPAAEPLVLRSPESGGGGLLHRLTAPWRPDARLTVALPAAAVPLGGELRAQVMLDNPQLCPLNTLRLEITGVETVRHLAATDVVVYPVGQLEVPLPALPRVEQEVVWTLPSRLAPTLRGRRFRLEWRLAVAATGPWQLGVVAEGPLMVYDAVAREPGIMVARREDDAPSEPEGGRWHEGSEEE